MLATRIVRSSRIWWWVVLLTTLCMCTCTCTRTRRAICELYLHLLWSTYHIWSIILQKRKLISEPWSLTMFAGGNTHKRLIDGKLSRRKMRCYSSRECSGPQTARKAACKRALGSALFENLKATHESTNFTSFNFFSFQVRKYIMGVDSFSACLLIEIGDLVSDVLPTTTVLC